MPAGHGSGARAPALHSSALPLVDLVSAVKRPSFSGSHSFVHVATGDKKSYEPDPKPVKKPKKGAK